jgi:energy-coupling factor transport system ATP-binding protein
VTVQLDSLEYRYSGAAEPALCGVTGQVRPGERVLLTGPSGCGKSTLLRLTAGLLQRFGAGTSGGTVQVASCDPALARPSERAALVALVSQDPGDQIVAGTVADEVAFAPESAGWGADRIEARIGEMLRLVELDVDPNHSPRALSGGQQQRLVVAASLAVGAPVLLLDEPLAQLDPAGARRLLERLDVLAAEGTAVLLVEHRLEPCLAWCDRVWWMEDGRVRFEGPPEEMGAANLRAGGLLVPELLEVEEILQRRGRSLGERGIDPLHPLRAPSPPRPTSGIVPASAPPAGPGVLRGRDLTFSWGSTSALRQVDFAVHVGERVAVLGANGAGKSTLLAALAGDVDAGPVEREGLVIGIPQDPDLSLFSESVREELAYGPEEAGFDVAEVTRRVEEVARDLSLSDLLDRPPQALSRGQRLRVAVGAALTCRPRVLLLDEPTAGQDHARVEAMLAALRTRMVETTLVFATHDVRLALRHATRVVVLHQGQVVADAAPEAVLTALPEEVPLLLPPLAELCVQMGLPLLAPAEFAERWD